MSGLASTLTFTGARAHGSAVSKAKCIDTLRLRLAPSRLPASATCTLILSVPFLPAGTTAPVTCTDRFTRWPEAMPLLDITAESIRTALITLWVSSYGVPSTITTDCGCQCNSTLLANLTRLPGVNHIKTTSYHLISNGVIEHFHWKLKASVMASAFPLPWIKCLPLLLLGSRTALRSDSSTCAAELTFGTTLRVPREFF
uniref:Putative gypsy nogag n=1 Tax=Amblyomma cajennense TaxID=34607 RepID=A0A023FD06_AMBCJ